MVVDPSPSGTTTTTTASDVPMATMNANAHNSEFKRKRSPSHEAMHPAPLPKAAKTSNHLQINYLARQCDKDLPLITNEDTLPNILSLLTDYQGVLDRHESMACNLGARPLGPILIKRFERLFDGPPKVLKSHGKDGTTVSWLDVVEFARNKPEQFQLGQMSEGARVCQFYTKQCRVQISEEDYVLISSGIPQKMIPPQPIMEDEEKELGTLDILDRNLGQICQLADQVAAITRQLKHRFQGRKQAILHRRATASPAQTHRPASPSNVALMNGAVQAVSATLGIPNQPAQPSQTSPGGFVPVNARPLPDQSGSNGASLTTRHELMSKFHTLTEQRPQSQASNGHSNSHRASIGPHSASHTPGVSSTNSITNGPNTGPSNLPTHPPALFSEAEMAHMLLATASPVPIPSTPSNLLPNATPRTSHPPEKDDGGPFKAEMMRRVEGLTKGERILPPCDRCRRLHMDCIKNLTACAGCTKKHAKCSWKEVREVELRASPSSHPPHRAGSGADTASEGEEDVKARMNSPSDEAQMAVMSPLHHQGGIQALPQPHTPASFSFGTPSGGIPDHRPSPPDRIAEQLQEAAKSGLAAHANANARLGVTPEHSKERAEFSQTMVA